MLTNILRGAGAGVAGTAALNVATYLDVAGRGRPPSSAPAQAVGRMAERAGVDLGAGSDGSSDEVAQNRRTGLGALFGYATGVGIGALYGLARPKLSALPAPVAGLLAGGAAMAVTDSGLVRLGVTDPRTWGVSGWLADIVPHIVYGVATGVAFDVLDRPGRS